MPLAVRTPEQRRDYIYKHADVRWVESEMKYVCKYPPVSNKIKRECALNSQILSADVMMSLNTRFIQRNLNVFFFGGSGQGKSRNEIKPNLLNANASYVTTDPSGDILMDTGYFLKHKKGYKIKVFNLSDMTKSMRYNPFAYVKSDKDIPILVKALTENIEGPKKGSGGENAFWDSAKIALISGLCGILYEAYPLEQRNFTNVMNLLRMGQLDESQPNKENDLDILFKDWEKEHPRSYAVKQYKTFKLAGGGKTAQNILITVAVLLGTYFDLDEFANLTYKDELNLEEIGEERCALYIITPQGNTTFNFMAATLYTQLFEVLYKQGEERMAREGLTNPTLKEHVSFYIDEMANIGHIPSYPIKLSTMRKYNMSSCPVFQSLAQLKELYEKEWEGIIGNCDAMVFLGGQEASTVKMLSEKLGKATIKSHNYSRNYSRGKMGGGGSSESHQNMGRELLTAAEVEQMPRNKELVFITGQKPFLTKKYPYEKHPNYRYTGEKNPKFLFPLTRFQLDMDYDTLDSVTVKAPSHPGYQPPKYKGDIYKGRIKSIPGLKPTSTECKGIPTDNFVVMHIVTTGALLGQNEVIELSIIDGLGQNLYTSYYRPKLQKFTELTVKNNLTFEDVHDAPEFPSEWEKIKEIVKDKFIVFYNYQEARNFIISTFNIHKNNSKEIKNFEQEFETILSNGYKDMQDLGLRMTLQKACETRKINETQRYRSEYDAIIVLKLLYSLAQEGNENGEQSTIPNFAKELTPTQELNLQGHHQPFQSKKERNRKENVIKEMNATMSHTLESTLQRNPDCMDLNHTTLYSEFLPEYEFLSDAFSTKDEKLKHLIKIDDN